MNGDPVRRVDLDLAQGLATSIGIPDAAHDAPAGERFAPAAPASSSSKEGQAMSRARVRRVDLDLAKGLGILLVVFGHLVAKTPPQGNAWYTIAQAAVYTFHMPFFVYLSGYVAFLTGAARVATPAWPALAGRRAERLLLPFLLFGALFVFGKLIASHYMYVDNSPRTFEEAVVGLVWKTDSSPAISIWYMFVIFVATIITPPLIWLGRGGYLLLLATASALFLLGLPHRLFADRFAEYFIFFVLGGIAADSGERWLALIDRYYLLALGMLALAIGGLFAIGSFSPHWSHLLCGCLSLAALHGLVRHRAFSHSRVLLFLGTYSFVIYLLNTPAIGISKGILIKCIPWDGPGFLLFALVMLPCGILVPVLVKRLVFAKWRYLDRLTD